MKFSLILNTRKRVKILDGFLTSVFEKTKNPDDIEILIKYDEDDEDSARYLSRYKNNPTFKIFSGPRPTSLNGSLSELAMKAEGQYIFLLNDDVEILTSDWDVRAYSNIINFKSDNMIQDDIIYGYTHDTSADRNDGAGYASFPIISRQAVRTLGFIMYPAFVGLGGDSSIHRVYKMLGRVVDTRIGLDHVFHNTIQRVMSPDETAAEMRANSAANPLDPYTYDISREVTKLKDFIDKYEPNYN